MNRRDLIKGMGVASIAAAVPVVALAKPAADRSAWNKATADHLRAYAESDAYDAPYNRISEAYYAAVKKVPHVSMPNGYGGTLSSASEWDVRHARGSCRTLRYVETCAYDGAKASQLFVDAADKRDAELEQIKKRYQWDEINERYDALQTAICDTETVLLNLPAPDSEALLWKIERLYKPGDGIWSEGVEDQTYADLLRFLSNGRA